MAVRSFKRDIDIRCLKIGQSCLNQILSDYKHGCHIKSSVEKLVNFLKPLRDYRSIIAAILTFITHKDGFGFNRVIMLLKKGNEVKPLFGLGPTTHSEGIDIYSKLSNIPFENAIGNVEAMIFDTEKLEEQVFYSILESVKKPESPINRAFNNMMPVVLNYTKAKEEEVYELLAGLGVTSLGIVPLKIESVETKVIFLIDNVVTLSPIDEDIVQKISAVLDGLLPYIERALLLMEIEAKEKELEAVRIDLEAKQSHIVAMEKLKAVRDLTSSIVHEIRNPLTVIGGYALAITKALEKGNADENQIKSMLSLIYDNAVRIDNILKSMDDLNSTLKMKKIKLNLGYVVKKAVKSISRRYPDLKVHLEIPDSSIYVEGDYNHISRFIENAVTNAYEACQLRAVNDPIVVSLKKSEGAAILVIEDKAGGIPESIIDKIYEPFFTTKSKGSGLGIPVMLMITKEHKGTMKIENTGYGVRVTLTLPLKED